MATNDREIYCTCGFRTELRNNYTFTNGPFKKINDWYFWQVDEIDINNLEQIDTNNNINFIVKTLFKFIFLRLYISLKE